MNQVVKAPAAPVSVVEIVDTTYLETLMGYNARRAALSIIEVFLQRMQPYGLRPVDFSVLSVIAHNPGVTSRQLCSSLSILPPNFVTLLSTLDKRELVQRTAHPHDRRAQSLYLTEQGQKLMRDAEQTAAHLEADATARLSTGERKTLIKLLQKVYLR
jgi:DNA-binding MarR family transcriptional regulator